MAPVTMKAAQWDKASQSVQFNEIPVPEPGPGQVRVAVVAASLCHSDLMQLLRPDIPPTTMGHEGVGIIDKVHPSAEGKGFKVGDRVGCNYCIDACYTCEGCLTHNIFCETGNAKLQGVSTHGWFAAYAIADWQNVAIIPEHMDLKRCSPIFCAGITAFHAVDSCELKAGEWFAVIGCGGLGQLATQYAKAMGFKVIGIDINDATLEVCKQQGADAVFNSRSNANYVEELKKLTNGGAHATAVFSDADAAYASAPNVLRVGGLVMAVGIPKSPYSLSILDLCLGKYRIKGESTSTPQRMHKAVEFTCKHNILPEVEFRKLEELPAMMEEMGSGKATKRMAVLFENA